MSFKTADTSGIQAFLCVAGQLWKTVHAFKEEFKHDEGYTSSLTRILKETVCKGQN